MINEFVFGMKTQIVFGKGVLIQVGDLAKGLNAKKIMLVADKGVRNTGLPDKVEKTLKDAKIAVVNFDKIVPNPRVTDCEEGAKIATKEGVDVFVAVGGGSTIDTAKAMAGMLGHNTVVFDDIKYPKEYTNDPYPLIAIPTTAGTGSEVTTSGVITDEETHTKGFCYDTRVAPTIALADPEVLMELPNHIAAATGVDALTHAIEGYVANCTCPVTEAFGLYAVEMLYKNLRKYIYQRDADVCEAMMMGSLLAGLSFGYSDTCAVHSLSETIGGQYDTPHGVANAIFLAAVTEYSIPGNMEKYVKVAKAMGVKSEGLTDRQTAQAGADEIKKLVEDLSIPKFSEIDRVDPADFQLLADRCEAHVSCPDNPRPLTANDFMKILNDAYQA